MAQKFSLNKFEMIMPDGFLSDRQSNTQNLFIDFIINEFSEDDSNCTDILKTGKYRVGFKLLNGLIINPKDFYLLRGLLLSYVIANYSHQVRNIYINCPVTQNDAKFIYDTYPAITSLYRHFTKKSVAKIEFTYILLEGQEDTSFAKKPLDYNSIYLGKSGGKESTLSNMVLAKSGYAINLISFKNSEEIIPDACMEIYSESFTKESDDIEYCLPELNLEDGKLFDAQDMLCIPRYGFLAYLAVINGSGLVGVGSEFGCSKVWHKHSKDSNGANFDVHDLPVDESKWFATKLEEFFKNYGNDIHIISPVAVLHELGIVRAIKDSGFDLAKLESCWMSTCLATNYCQCCYKCQRLEYYYSKLHKKYPEGGWDKIVEFTNFNVATGSMLSYALQYHLTEDYPDLPWDTSIIVDDTGLSFLDYRTGNRILKTLKNDFGFTDTIHVGELNNPLELRLQDCESVIEKIKNELNMDMIKIKSTLPVLNSCELMMPWEMTLDDAAASLELSENYIDNSIISRYDQIPVYFSEEDYWAWFDITGNKENPKKLHFSRKMRNMPVFKLWMNYTGAIKSGFRVFKIPHRGLIGIIPEQEDYHA